MTEEKAMQEIANMSIEDFETGVGLETNKEKGLQCLTLRRGSPGRSLFLMIFKMQAKLKEYKQILTLLYRK